MKLSDVEMRCRNCEHATPLDQAGWPKQGDLMECAVNGFRSDSGEMVSPDWVLPDHSCEKFKQR